MASIPKPESYADFVQASHDLYLRAGGKEAPLEKLSKPAGLSAQPKVLILAPHPDDECLMGGYALRMAEEWGAQVSVLAYSYGSAIERQEARAKELDAAVKRLGFSLISRTSFGKLTQNEFDDHVAALKPDIIFSPHEKDGHPAHMESWAMVHAFSKKHKFLWVQSEFWHAIEHPNLMVPLSVKHVTQMGEALAKHVGEVERNPYHLRLPAWCMDNVRRGSERVQGAGAKAVDSVFAQLYLQLQT